MDFSGALKLSRAAGCFQQNALTLPRRSTLRSTADPDLTLASGSPHRGPQVHSISEEIPPAAKHKVPESLVSAQLQTDLVGLPKNNPPGGDHNIREVPLPLLSHHPKSGGHNGGVPKNRHSIRQKKAIQNIIQGIAEGPCTRARCRQSRPNTRRVSRGSESEHPPCRLFVLGFHSRGSGTVTQKNRPTTRRRHDSHRRIIVCEVKRENIGREFEFPTAANMTSLGPSSGLEPSSSEGKPVDTEVKVKRKRGRPFKVVNSFPTGFTIDSEVKVKRKRGRPVKVKRKRGRPFKVVNSLPTGFTIDSEVKVKRKRGRPFKVKEETNGGKRRKVTCGGGQCLVDDPTAQRRPSPAGCDPGTPPQHHLVLSGAQLVNSFPTEFTNIISLHPKPMWVAASERPVRRSVKTPSCGLCGVCMHLPYQSKLWAQQRLESTSPKHPMSNSKKKHSESNNGHKKITVWISTYPKVTLCDVAKRFDVRHDCGYMLPAALKTKAVHCFQRDLKARVLLKTSTSDQCGNNSPAKCRKRSSSPHKLTDPQMKGSRQYTAVDPTCQSPETGKGELELPTNCSASLSLGKMETKVQCGAGILERHTDDEPEAGCVLIVEERQAVKKIKQFDGGTNGILPSRPYLEISLANDQVMVDTVGRKEIESVDSQSCLDSGIGCSDTSDTPELELSANCSASLSHGTMETKAQCGILDRHIDDDPEAGCALMAEERQAESDLLMAEKVMVDTEMESVMSVDSQSCFDTGIGCSDTSDTPVEKYRDQVDSSDVAQGSYTSAKCRKRSSHKLTAPQMKHPRQYKAVDPTCHSLETGKGELERPANCSASLSLGKMETKEQCGTGILDRHIDDDPESGCALIAEERQAESDLIVAVTVGREEIESVVSQSCLDSGIGCSDTSDTPVEKYSDQVDSSCLIYDLKESDVSQRSSQLLSQNSGEPHLLEDDDNMEEPELFSCQRARVYFKPRHFSCARTYIHWPFNKSRDPAPEIPAAIETLPAGMSYPPAREDVLITSQLFSHQGKDGERDEEVPNRREDGGEHTAVEKDVKIGTNQFPHSFVILEPLANAPSGMAILSSPSHVRETASHLYTHSPIPHDLLANCTDMVTADTPPIVYSSDLIFHHEEKVTTSSSRSPESPLNSNFSHSYRSSHISSSEETDASEQSPKSTAPSNSDFSDSCKSSLISSPDRQEHREDDVLPKKSKYLNPLANSDDLTLDSGKECSLLNYTTEQVSVHLMACSAADGDEGNSIVVNSRQENEKLSCCDGGSTQSSDDMLTSPSKMASLWEDEPEVEAAEESNTNCLDEFTAYENDILLLDVMQDDPDLFGNLPKETLLKLGPTRVLGKWSSGTAKQSSSLVKAEMSSTRFDPRLRGQIPENDDRQRCWKTLCSSTSSLTQGSTWFPTEERNQATDILDDNNNYLEEDDPERNPFASVSLRETEPARACQSFTDLRLHLQKFSYCRWYFSENQYCSYEKCRFRHVPVDERFCFEAMKLFINSQNPKCLQKAGAVFTSYYNSNPMGVYFSMPVLMSLLRAMLKAGSVSDIISVIIISLTRNVMPGGEFLQALLNFVIEKGLNAFVPQLTQLTSKVVNAGQAQNLDCIELARIMSTPVVQNLTHALMEVELCTKQEDWKQLGVVFKSLCQSSQVTSELERISGQVSIALLSETKDKLALPFVTFAETACEDESDDGVIKIFVGRIGVSLMVRYHKTHQWAQGKRVVEVLSRLQVKYSMLKGLFGNEDGASRCCLVTIATELFLMSDSVEGALNVLRDNEWFLSSSSWPCEPCDLEKRSHVLIRLAAKTSYREALDVFSNLPGLKEPIDHIDASQYGALLNSHLQVCVNKQALIVAADTALFIFSKNLGIDTGLLQMLLIKLGKQSRWNQARKVFKQEFRNLPTSDDIDRESKIIEMAGFLFLEISLSVGHYPDVSAPPGLLQLTVTCSLEEAELALLFEMFITVNATAILNLEDPNPVLRITLKRTHQCEKEYVSAGNRIYSAAGIPFPKLKLTLHRTEGIGSQEQVFILDTLKARCWLRQNLWAKDFWTHPS